MEYYDYESQQLRARAIYKASDEMDNSSHREKLIAPFPRIISGRRITLFRRVRVLIRRLKPPSRASDTL